MRYYNIEIFKKGEDFNRSHPTYHFSSHKELDGRPAVGPFSGIVDNSALRVEFEYTLTNSSIIPSLRVTIYGLDLLSISQSNHLNDGYIKLSAGVLGFSVDQNFAAGEIFTGKINRSIGNWGTDDKNEKIELFSSLELICAAASMDFTPAPRFFTCESGDLLADKIKATLNGYDLELTQLSGLKCPQYEYFRSNNMPEFIQQLTQATSNWGEEWQKKRISGHYNSNGVISFSAKTSVTEVQPSKKINFKDILGQPQYRGSLKDGKEAQNWEVTLTTPLRSDINIGDTILLPSSSEQGNCYGFQKPCGDPAANQSLFSGKWQVLMIHHVGESRDLNSKKWATTFGLKKLS